MPGRTCDAIFYVSVAKGGLGLHSIVDEIGNMMITHAVKMFTSPDPLVRGGCGKHPLECTISKRFEGTEGHEDQWQFLANQLKSATESLRGDVCTIWCRLGAFAGETGVCLHGGTSNDPTPTGISIVDHELSGSFRRVLLWELHTKRGKTWLGKWASLAVTKTISQVSESRHCYYMRYREYQ